MITAILGLAKRTVSLVVNGALQDSGRIAQLLHAVLNGGHPGGLIRTNLKIGGQFVRGILSGTTLSGPHPLGGGQILKAIIPHIIKLFALRLR